MSYARVASIQYKPGKMEGEVLPKIHRELEPILRKEVGFLWYKIVTTDHDKGVALTCWDSREHADAGMKEVGRWADEKLGDIKAGGDSWLGEVRIELQGSPSSTAVVQALYSAFNDKDLNRAAGFLTADAKAVNVATGEEVPYRDGIRFWATAFKDGRIELTRVVQSGDVVVAEYVARGTHTGPMHTRSGEIAPTNKRVELKFVDVLELRDGRITRGRSYFDSASLLRQIGALPALSVPAGAQKAARPELRH